MELDLDRQEHGRAEIDISGTLDLGLGEGSPDTVTIAGILEVQNIASRFLISGQLQASGKAECGRCLNEFALQWDVPVSLMVIRNVDSDEEEGETLLILQSRGVADLQPTLRECTVLAYPQSPVCREACKGMCITCGIDLNHEVCQCKNEDYDPRWEGLPE